MMMMMGHLLFFSHTRYVVHNFFLCILAGWFYLIFFVLVAFATETLYSGKGELWEKIYANHPTVEWIFRSRHRGWANEIKTIYRVVRFVKRRDDEKAMCIVETTQKKNTSLLINKFNEDEDKFASALKKIHTIKSLWGLFFNDKKRKEVRYKHF